MLIQNSSKDKDESDLLRTGLSRAVNRPSISFSLKLLPSLVEKDKTKKKSLRKVAAT